jgi:hypothetical protein
LPSVPPSALHWGNHEATGPHLASPGLSRLVGHLL